MRWAGRIFAMAAIVLVVCGCATIPASPLGHDAAAQFRLDAVHVKVASDAVVLWGNAEDEYVKSRPADVSGDRKPKAVTAGLATNGATGDAEYTAAAASPEAQAFVRAKAAAKLKDALDSALRAELQRGARPVRLEVTIHHFDVPSAVRRVVVGGIPTIIASAELIDAGTGTVLASRPNFVATAYAGNGWLGVAIDQAMEDLDARLANQYATTYRDWLLNKNTT